MSKDAPAAPALPHLSEDGVRTLVDRARRLGASDAAVRVVETRALGASVRDGALTGLSRSESASLSVTAYFGRRRASQSTSDLSAAGVDTLVEEVVSMARAASEDPHAGLPPEGLAASGDDECLALCDPDEPTAPELKTRAFELDAAARTTPGLLLSEASATWSRSESRYATSQGVVRTERRSRFAAGAGAVAADASGRETGHRGANGVWRDQLADPRIIGAEAARRATEKLGGRKISSREAPVLFDRSVALDLIDPLVQAMDGGAVASKRSFLSDRLYAPIFSPWVQIVDDPFVVRGRGSRAADAEAVTPARRALVDNGVLTTWLMDCSSARRLGLASTGHASGLHNLDVQAGRLTPAELRAHAGAGLLVTTTFSPSLNIHSGDWSMGVGGFWFEAGEIRFPVSEVTVAGNLLDLYANLIVGSDLVIENAANSPSLLAPSMTISGA